MASSAPADAPPAADAGAAAAPGPKKKPTVVLLIGMAGAGKTTMFHRLNYHCASEGLNAYYVNLDPAVLSIPFTPHVDVRDTVDYREVMKQYKLGPNGAEEVLPVGDITDYEKGWLEKLIPELKASIDKGIEFANKD